MKTHNDLFLATNIVAILAVGILSSPAADEPAAQSSPAETSEHKFSFDFEQDTGGWENAWKTPYLTTVEVSEEQALSGKHSLKLSFDNPTDEQQVVNVVLPRPQNLESGDTMVVHYWLPDDCPVTAVQPAIGSDAIAFAGQFTGDLVKGEWKELAFPIPDGAGSISDAIFQAFLPPQSKGVFYLDDITW